MPNARPFKNRSGKIVWRVQFRIGTSVKSETFSEKKDADEFAEMVSRVGGKAAREFYLTRVANAEGAPTFAAWVHTYLSPESGILTGIQPGTRHGYERIAERALTPFFGEYPINTITRDDVGRWVQWVEGQSSGRDVGKLISAKTVKNYQALLSNIFKAAVERGNIPANPVRGVRTSKGQSRKGVFLTPHEFSRLLEQVPAYYKPFVVFLANTGTRWGEATALTWADIELSTQPATAHINKAWKKGVDGKPVLGPPKSEKGTRTIPLGQTVLEWLPPKGDPRALVFTGREGGRLWYGMFNTRIWKPAVERAKIGKSPNLHDLRHSYASWLVAAGAPLNVVQQKLGHEDIRTTIHTYSHASPGADMDVVGVLDRAMSGVTKPALELAVDNQGHH